MVELFDSLPAAPVLRTFAQHLIVLFSRPDATNDDVPGGFVGLIEIQLEAIVGGIFKSFFCYILRPEIAASDIICG